MPLPLWIGLGAISASTTVAVAGVAYMENESELYNIQRTKAISECLTDFDTAHEISKLVKAGDLVEFKRKTYQHWGVFVADDCLVHLINLGDGNAKIVCESLIDVADNNPCRVNNLIHQATRLSLAEKSTFEVIKFAIGSVGRVQKYSLKDNNCEHFATECRYGTPFSTQSDIAKKNKVVDKAADFTDSILGRSGNFSNTSSKKVFPSSNRKTN